MYRHQILTFGKFQKQHISNDQTGNSFTFVSEQGASIIDLQFGNQAILDGCETALELDLNNWGKSAILLPFPNRLRDGTYIWKNMKYQFPINDTLTNNALHGFVKDEKMEISEIGLHADRAYVKCVYRHNGSNISFPFPFEFTITYEIDNSNQFEVSFSVENIGNSSFPIGMGWHPYFKLSDKIDESTLRLDACHLVGIDERMLPTGKKYAYTKFAQAQLLRSEVLDNCFQVDDSESKRYTLDFEGKNGKIHYWQETGAGKFNFIQLFTPPNRNALAIEPMTCNVDAFNNKEGLKILQPEEVMTAKFGLKYSH